MGVHNFEDLIRHFGHELECVTYGEPPENVAIECITCGEVLVDYDRVQLPPSVKSIRSLRF